MNEQINVNNYCIYHADNVGAADGRPTFDRGPSLGT